MDAMPADTPAGPALARPSPQRDSLPQGGSAVLAQVVAHALEVMGTADLAGVSIGDVHVVAPATRKRFATELLELESQFDGGPCHQAALTATPVRADDLGPDSRWPDFGRAAAVLGMRSTLAVPLAGPSGGVLYFHAHRAGAFDAEAESEATRLAALAVAVSAAGAAEVETQARNLWAALDSREVIGQAQGVLMERRRLSAEEAFDHLRRASQRLNRKLKDVAVDLVETGEDPLPDVAPEAVAPDEAARIAAVRRYDVLDTPADGAFDRIAALAARVCETPIAIVSIVDSDRIWFKARHGIDAQHTERDLGLCASAILHDGPWVVEDAATDPRALANPLVAGESGLRFYLGIPLRTHDGFNLGTLCVLDVEPRQATDRQIADLADLAAMVVDELEWRLAARNAVLIEARFRTQATELAAQLQESLLPPTLPDMDGLELAAQYLPSHSELVGGDFYDAFEGDGAFGLVVGDVSGHGPSAAGLSTMARHTVRALALDDWQPKLLLRKLNTGIRRLLLADDQRFCTAALVRLDRDGTHLTASVALGGHPRPIVLRADSRIEVVGEAGHLLGPFADPKLHEVIVDLAPGDALVLYTDGLTDAVETFDESKVCEVLRTLAGGTAAELAGGLVDAVKGQAVQPRDDIAVLVARVCPGGDPQVS